MTDWSDGKTQWLLLGTYARNGGAGLTPLDLQPERWALGEPHTAIKNASFAVWSERHAMLYCVDEQGDGALNFVRRAGTSWVPAGRVSTHGAEPCHLALDGDERCLAVANYGSGSVALFRLDPQTGVPLEPPTVMAHAGGGPVADRQDGAHAHWVCFSPDRRWLWHVDLGTDEIIAYPFDAETGSIGAGRAAFAAPPGSGPRLLTLHPDLPIALLVSELASTLTVLAIADGTLTARQVISTLPEGFGGTSLGGYLAINRAGDRAYVTNRGHDSIAVFRWDGGALELLQHEPSRGASPRAFLLLEAERQLVLANEEGGNIAIFAVREDGTLAPSGPEIAAPGAAFVLVEPR